MKNQIIHLLLVFGLVISGTLQYELFAQATYESAQSGNFSDGSTWVGGQEPPDMQHILIKSGHTVTLDRGTDWNDWIYVWDVTVESGAVLESNNFPLWIRTTQTSNPRYRNDGIHNGPGSIMLNDYYYTRITGSGVTNTDFEIYNYGVEVEADCDLTINGSIKPMDPFIINGNQWFFIRNEVGGSLTVNGDLISPVKPSTNLKYVLNNFIGSLTVNGNITFAGASDVIENRSTLIVSGSLTLGSNTGSYFWNRNQGYAEIGGDVLGGGSCYLRHGNDAHIKFGGQVFPAGFGGTLQAVSPTDLNMVEYNGTSSQIVKPFNLPYRNLTINNSSPDGVTLSDNLTVNVTLSLSNGHLHLLDYNLLLGPEASVGGNFSVSSMVIATGSGELRKQFQNPGNFTFPVGDNDGTPEYSPVYLEFTTGSFSNAYAGVKLVNEPFLEFYGSHLNRYWLISSAGITGFTCQADFHYTDGDVVGNEDLIYCFRVEPTSEMFSKANLSQNILSAEGLTSFGTFTGMENTVHIPVDLRVFLEGPFELTEMHTGLNDDNLLPLSQPYNLSPWNYPGEESVPAIPSADIVDWVLIELRDAPSAALATTETIVQHQAAFLKKNGHVVGMDGSAYIQFNISITHQLFVVIRHRNHLDIMSNTPLMLENDPIAFDFTSNVFQAFGGAAGFKELLPGIAVMVAADANADGMISMADKIAIWQSEAGSKGYLMSDLDLDSQVQNNDKNNHWLLNYETGYSVQIPE